jgi:surface polysaccharide O-acyltransferase-like enzyme
VFDFRLDKNWLGSLFIQSFFRWPVPVFFMLCGANLLCYRERYSTKSYFIKRVKRVFIPFLVWSFIWLLFNYSMGWIPPLSINNIAKLFIYNNIQDIFWFFYAIIGIYFCIPILSLLAKRENKKAIEYFIAICLIQTGIIPLIFALIQQPIPWYTELPIVGGYLSYVLSGWYLVTFPMKKKYRHIIYIIGAISGVLIFIGTYYFSLQSKQLNSLFFDYNTIFTYAISISIFIWFQSIHWDRFFNEWSIKMITILSSTSFGVYIIHKFIIDELDLLFHFNNSSFYYMIVQPLLVYIICVFVIYLLKKTPLIRYIIP